MKSGWVTKRVGEIVKTLTPPLKVPAKNYLCGGHFPVVSQDAELISGFSNEAKGVVNVDRPLVIFGDHTKVVKYIDFDFVQGADGVKILDVADEIDPRLFYYAVRNIHLRNLGYARHFKLLKESELCYPTAAKEQKQIVTKIDAAFEKIDKLKANAERNLANAKELFQSALDEAMRPKKGWVEKRLGEVYNFIDYRGKTPNKINEGVPLVTARNIRMGYLDYAVRDYISQAEYKTRQSRGIAHKGDILFTTEAPLGFVALADLDEFSTGQRVITFQQHKGSSLHLLNKFYFYYFQANGFQSEIRKQATGATAQGIKASRLREIPIAVVPYAEQQQVVKRLDVLAAKTGLLEQHYTRQIADCAEMRQSVLREAFEGWL